MPQVWNQTAPRPTRRTELRAADRGPAAAAMGQCGPMTANEAPGPDRHGAPDRMFASRRRLIAAVVTALVVGLVVGLLAAWEASVLVAWCSGAAAFVGHTARLILPADAERTRSLA